MAKPPASASQQAPKSSKQPESGSAIEQEIVKRVSAVVGRDKAGIVSAQIISVISEHFRGPIAHPRHMREYEEICPGSADRIITMAEDQLKHDQAMDNKVIKAEVDDLKQGRLYGFLALMALIVAAVSTGLAGHTILAGSFLGAGVLGVVGAFINGRRR